MKLKSTLMLVFDAHAETKKEVNAILCKDAMLAPGSFCFWSINCNMLLQLLVMAKHLSN